MEVSNRFGDLVRVDLMRLAAEYRELYCRGCSTYWVEGRTVRTRLRRTGRVRTCLRCGRVRRTPAGRRARRTPTPSGVPAPLPRDEGALVDPIAAETEDDSVAGGGEEEG